MNTIVRRWGNTLAVRIPAVFAKELDLVEGSEIELTPYQGGLLLRPRKRRQTLDDMLADITPENIHGETDWGSPVGREAW